MSSRAGARDPGEGRPAFRRPGPSLTLGMTGWLLFAQFVPPVPKTITGGRTLHRVSDIPLPAPKQQWVRARSAHFLTISSAGQRRTRDVVDELETVAAALRQLDPHLAAGGDLTRLILFARTRDGLPYFELLVGRPDTPGAVV